MIYFISTCDHRDSPIKIGYSHDAGRRLKTLQVASPYPLYMCAFIPDGDMDCERRIHHKFAAGRMFGEWFQAATPGLRDFISDVAHYEVFPWDIRSPAHQHVADIVRRPSPYPLPTLQDFQEMFDDDSDADIRAWLSEEILEIQAYKKKPPRSLGG